MNNSYLDELIMERDYWNIIDTAKEEAMEEGRAEGFVSQSLSVVAEAYKLGVGDCSELTQGQVQTLNEGPDKADNKGQECGQDENRSKLADRPLHQINILFAFCQDNTLNTVFAFRFRYVR